MRAHDAKPRSKRYDADAKRRVVKALGLAFCFGLEALGRLWAFGWPLAVGWLSFFGAGFGFRVLAVFVFWKVFCICWAFGWLLGGFLLFGGLCLLATFGFWLAFGFWRLVAFAFWAARGFGGLWRLWAALGVFFSFGLLVACSLRLLWPSCLSLVLWQSRLLCPLGQALLSWLLMLLVSWLRWLVLLLWLLYGHACSYSSSYLFL